MMTDTQLMQLAIDEAKAAAAIDEVPVGCVIVDAAGQVIGRGQNRREIDADPTAHAEIVAMRQAARHLGYWRLVDCTLVVTLEPCPMCAGAIVNSRVKRVVYGCDDPKAGAARTLYQLLTDPRLNHRAEVVAGVMAEECAQLLREFFRAKRRPD
jgi:tRNA(adenine34) deaminase